VVAAATVKLLAIQALEEQVLVAQVATQQLQLMVVAVAVVVVPAERPQTLSVPTEETAALDVRMTSPEPR
jgi:hypothetical protein